MGAIDTHPGGDNIRFSAAVVRRTRRAEAGQNACKRHRADGHNAIGIGRCEHGTRQPVTVQFIAHGVANQHTQPGRTDSGLRGHGCAAVEITVRP